MYSICCIFHKISCYRGEEINLPHDIKCSIFIQLPKNWNYVLHFNYILISMISNFLMIWFSGQAVLEYELEDSKKTMNMYHTGVPVEYRGHGIAKYLVEVSFMHCFLSIIIFKIFGLLKGFVLAPFAAAKALKCLVCLGYLSCKGKVESHVFFKL